MRGVGAALAEGLGTPVRRFPLVLAFWLARLFPILLGFTLPLHAALRAQTEAHPDARLLLGGSRDATGFVHAFTSDFFREGYPGAESQAVLLVVAGWFVVTFLAGGVTARLLGGDGLYGSFLGKCGRYAGRLFRLALLFALLLYAADAAVNVCLAETHRVARLAEHTEDLRIRNDWIRGALTVGIAALLGLVHAYARIDIVAHDRRSALLSLLRAFYLLLRHLPKLLVVEGGMFLAAQAALLVAFLVASPGRIAGPESTSGGVALAVLLVAASSYLRTGIEVGAMAARCRILRPPEPDAANP